jgi:hypothetical protein
MLLADPRGDELFPVALVVQWLMCLPLDPKVAGLNPAKAMDF